MLFILYIIILLSCSKEANNGYIPAKDRYTFLIEDSGVFYNSHIIFKVTLKIPLSFPSGESLTIISSSENLYLFKDGDNFPIKGGIVIIPLNPKYINKSANSTNNYEYSFYVAIPNKKGMSFDNDIEIKIIDSSGDVKASDIITLNQIKKSILHYSEDGTKEVEDKDQVDLINKIRDDLAKLNSLEVNSNEFISLSSDIYDYIVNNDYTVKKLPADKASNINELKKSLAEFKKKGIQHFLQNPKNTQIKDENDFKKYISEKIQKVIWIYRGTTDINKFVNDLTEEIKRYGVYVSFTLDKYDKIATFSIEKNDGKLALSEVAANVDEFFTELSQNKKFKLKEGRISDINTKINSVLLSIKSIKG